MRKILISLLMVSAATVPTLAAAQDSASARRAARDQARTERQSAREDRSSMREERSATREERTAPRAERRAPAAQQQAATAQQQANVDARDPRRERMVGTAQGDERRAATAAERTVRQAQQVEQRDQRQATYQAQREARRNAGPPPISRTPQPNTQPPPPVTSRPTVAPQWNSSWRNNSRYNWSRYRHRHNWLFNLGFYYDPFGWGYSPFSVGYRMWPSYYGSQYWLNDPWQYRLPYAPPGTRWIRYYDDVMLIDTWSGQVVDVIYDFFW
ncbi:MAG: RcnB family protein [Sphingomicrobium sp.]